MMKWINRQLFSEIRFTRNAFSGDFATNRHESCGLIDEVFNLTTDFWTDHETAETGKRQVAEVHLSPACRALAWSVVYSLPSLSYG